LTRGVERKTARLEGGATGAGGGDFKCSTGKHKAFGKVTGDEKKKAGGKGESKRDIKGAG